MAGVGPLSTPPLYYEEMSKKTNTTVESVLSFVAGLLSELKLLESKLLEVLPKKKFVIGRTLPYLDTMYRFTKKLKKKGGPTILMGGPLEIIPGPSIYFSLEWPTTY